MAPAEAALRRLLPGLPRSRARPPGKRRREQRRGVSLSEAPWGSPAYGRGMDPPPRGGYQGGEYPAEVANAAGELFVDARRRVPQHGAPHGLGESAAAPPPPAQAAWSNSDSAWSDSALPAWERLAGDAADAAAAPAPSPVLSVADPTPLAASRYPGVVPGPVKHTAGAHAPPTMHTPSDAAPELPQAGDITVVSLDRPSSEFQLPKGMVQPPRQIVEVVGDLLSLDGIYSIISYVFHVPSQLWVFLLENIHMLGAPWWLAVLTACSLGRILFIPLHLIQFRNWCRMEPHMEQWKELTRKLRASWKETYNKRQIDKPALTKAVHEAGKRYEAAFQEIRNNPELTGVERAEAKRQLDDGHNAELKVIRDRFDSTATPHKVKAEMEEFQKRHNFQVWFDWFRIHDIVPIICGLLAVNQVMGRDIGQSMNEGGLLWLTNLTQPDPYGLLPILLASTFLILKVWKNEELVKWFKHWEDVMDDYLQTPDEARRKYRSTQVYMLNILFVWATVAAMLSSITAASILVYCALIPSHLIVRLLVRNPRFRVWFKLPWNPYKA